MDQKQPEALEGYIVDLACIRRYPISEMLERARQHTRDCALMGHCVESGYGLVQDDGTVVPLDTHATPHVGADMRTVSVCASEGEEMRTETVENA